MHRIMMDVKWGISWGMKISAVFGILAAIAVVTAGEPTLAKHGTTFAELLRLYFLGGLLGGATLGVLRPITASRLGITLVGVCVAFVVWLAFLALFVGITNLGGFDYFTLACAALLGGPFGASFFWPPVSNDAQPHL